MANITIPHGPNGEAPLLVWDPIGKQLLPLQGASVVTDSSGQTYAVLNTSNSIGGNPVSANNPYPSADTIRMLIQNGQGYTASVVGTTAGAGNNVGLAFYTGAAGITKNMFIYRIICGSTQAGSQFMVDFQAADYALGTAASAVNLKNGGGASLLANFSSSLNATLAGTVFTQGLLSANQSLDVLQASLQGYLIPANTQLSMVAAANTKGAVGTVVAQLWWVEY